MSNQLRTERRRDEALADSFPASDPPATSGITGAGTPSKPSDERDVEEIPTGLPNSDRHGAETIHHREDEVAPGEKDSATKKP